MDICISLIKKLKTEIDIGYQVLIINVQLVRSLSVLHRFEATRRIRSNESEVNEKIASGEVLLETFGNVAHWHTPILAMTADVIQASNEQCMKCGMDDYVSKPFDEEQLYSAVARFFESSR